MWKLKAGKKRGTRALHFVWIYYYAWIDTSKDLAFFWLSFLGLVEILHFIGSVEWQLFNIHCQSHVFENFLNRSKNVTQNEEYCLWVKAQVKKSTDTTAGRVFIFLVLKIDLARHNSGTLVRKIDCRLLISASSRRTQSLRKIGPRTTLLLCTILF